MEYDRSSKAWTPRRSKGNTTFADIADEEELNEHEQEVTAPEFATLCPQPRRAVLPPNSPGEHASLPGSPYSCTVDEACQELRELMGRGGDKEESFTSLGGRPLSSVSTSAGPTPSPDSRPSTVPPTPQWPVDKAKKDLDESEDRITCSTPALTESSRTSTAKTPRHKVFVGGIPQDMDSEEVRTLLSEFAPVKKAWLQKHKETSQCPGSLHKHRGFGFVIFTDAAAVDRILGENGEPRFIALRDGKQRIEVKRAISSTEMLKSAESEVASDSRQRNAKQPGPIWGKGGRGSPQPSQGPPGIWPADPRQSQQGGWGTPEQRPSSAILATPPREPPQHGRSTPVPPPPSPCPWGHSQSPSPPPMMATTVMALPQMVQQAAPVLAVGNGMAPMGMAPRPPASQHPPAPTPPPTPPPNAAVAGQAMAFQAPAGCSRPAIATCPMPAGWQPVQLPRWCSVPMAMDLMRGGAATYAVAAALPRGPAQPGACGYASAPCPPPGWQAQWEAANAALVQQHQQQQQAAMAQQQQHQQQVSQQQLPPPQQQQPQQQHQPQQHQQQLPHQLQPQQQPQQPQQQLQQPQQQQNQQQRDQDQQAQPLPIADRLQQPPPERTQTPAPPQRPQTPASPHHGNEAYARELEVALLQAMPDHYDE